MSLGAGIVAFATCPAKAQTSTIIGIDCETVPQEARSSAEARARAELTMQGTSGGWLQIRCEAPLLVVKHVALDGKTRTSSAPLATDVNQWVESVLSQVHDVTTATPQALVPQPVAAESKPEQTPATASTTPAPQVEPLPAPHGGRRAEQPPPTQPAAALDPASPIKVRPIVAVGLCTDLLVDSFNLLPGPCIRAGLRLNDRWRVALTATLQWGVWQPESIAIRSGHGGIDVRYGRTWWLSSSVELSALHLVSTGALAPNTHNVTELVFSPRAGLTRFLGGNALSAGLGVNAFTQYHDVRVNGHEVYRLYPVVLAADVEYELDL